MPSRMAPDLLPLRERKKQRTHRELQAAALALFGEHGFERVTTDDIAAAAEVSKTTFYRYFTSKEEVLLGNPETGLQEVRRALAERPGDEPVLDSVREALLALAGGFEDDRATMLARGHLIRTTSSLKARYLEQQAAFEQVIVQFVAERRGVDHRADLAARLLGAQTMAALRVALDFWLDHEGRPDLIELVRRALAGVARDVDPGPPVGRSPSGGTIPGPAARP